MYTSAFEINIKHIENEITRQSNHVYLDKYLSKPKVSTVKLRLLYLFLASQSYTDEDISAICIATGLIQMGLDIHDQVTNESLETQEQIRIRQLQVLAGDYFSSLYYRLLARSQNMDAIQKLAQSVQRSNEQKVIYYQAKEKIHNDLEQWLNYKAAIELSIYYGIVHDEDWLRLISSFIHIHLLYFSQPQKKWDPKTVYRKLEHAIQSLKEQLAKFKSTTVFPDLQKLYLPFENIITNSLVAEEI